MAIHWGGKGPGHVSRWPKAVGPVNTYSGATMLLDFLNPVLDPRITFSRGTGATRVNASGFIETVGNTTPRFDYDPVTLAPRGLLIEEARTNLVTYSDDLSNAAWTKNRVSAVANATASPDGTSNADKINGDGTNGGHNVSQAVTILANTSYTLTAYAKAAELSWMYIFVGGTGAGGFSTFNVATGTLGSLSGVITSRSITPAGNGWYRVQISLTTGATVGANFVEIAIANADTTGANTASGGIFAYGAQLEAGSFATSYIPTVASTVTRNADVATMTGTNFSSWYNQSEGTIVAETALIAKSAASYGIYAFDDGTTNNAYPSFYSTGLQANSRVSGANVFTSSGTLSPISKSAFAYKIADYASSFNGASPTTQLSGAIPSGLNRLQIGAYNGFQTNGHIRTIAYYNTRLPNAQLQTLTAPSLATTLSLDFTSGSYNVGF